MAAMLLTTSCAKDEANEPASGEQVTASFNVQLPTGINARQAKGPKKAYADGTTAKTLKYMVFDASGKRVAGVGGETAINLTTTVQLQLTPGKENWIGLYDADGITLIDEVTIPAILVPASVLKQPVSSLTLV